MSAAPDAGVTARSPREAEAPGGQTLEALAHVHGPAEREGADLRKRVAASGERADGTGQLFEQRELSLGRLPGARVELRQLDTARAVKSRD